VWGGHSPRVWASASPTTIVSAYMTYNRDPDASRTLPWWKANHPSWVLYECDRVTPVTIDAADANIALDVSNPDVVAWQVATYASSFAAQGYAAVAADNFTPYNFFRACGVWADAATWRPLYNGSLTEDPAYEAARLGWLSAFRDALRGLTPPLLLVPNFSLGALPAGSPTAAGVLARVDGVLDERGFTGWGAGFITDAEWVNVRAWARALQAAGKAYFSVNELGTAAAPALTPAARNFIVASWAMLNEGASGVFMSCVQCYGWWESQPEYGLRVGAPLAPAAPGGGASGAVWARPFEDGLAFVNPVGAEPTSVALSAGAAFVDAQGNEYRGSVALPGGAGLLLRRLSPTHAAAPPAPPQKVASFTPSALAGAFSMVNLYFPWMDIQTGPRSFSFGAVDAALAAAEEKGAQLIFRVYADYPGQPYAMPPFLRPGLGTYTYTESGGGLQPDYSNVTLTGTRATLMDHSAARTSDASTVAERGGFPPRARCAPSYVPCGAGSYSRFPGAAAPSACCAPPGLQGGVPAVSAALRVPPRRLDAVKKSRGIFLLAPWASVLTLLAIALLLILLSSLVCAGRRRGATALRALILAFASARSAAQLAVTTLAGSGTSAFADGTGTGAAFSIPWGLAIDTSGNIFVGDFGNHRIRKMTPGGVVSTLAGSGSTTLVNAVGTAAAFWNPRGVAVDDSGNVYVADQNNHRIRKVTSGGAASSLAGSNPGFADGTGTNAMFSNPNGVAVNAAGTVFVADTSSQRVRIVTPDGAVSTLAGSMYGFADGTGVGAFFRNPYGVAVDAGGNVVVADSENHRIRRVSPVGAVTTLAGSGSAVFADGVGAAASFNNPYGLAVDAFGNVLVADLGNQRIRKVTPGGVVSTLAGSSAVGFTDGTGATALFSSPRGVTVDSSGTIFVADSENNRIRKLACAAGSYSASCTPCPAGSFCPAGASAPAPCPAGRYSAAGSADCLCPSGWATGPASFCFIAVGFELSWQAAASNCASLSAGATLATLRSSLEAATVVRIAPQGVGSWTGLNYLAALSAGAGCGTSRTCPGWTWHRGGESSAFILSAAGQAMWGFGEPNNFAESEHCGQLHSNGVLNDNACANALRSICEVAQTVCPAGSFCTAGASFPTLCPAGTYSAASGASSSAACLPCNAGSFSAQGATSCAFTVSTCPVGTYANGAAACAPCSPATACTVVGLAAQPPCYWNVSTLAGSGAAGSANGQGTAAVFYGPLGVSVDPSSLSVYVGDLNNNRVRRISPSGMVTTYAGSGSAAFADGVGTAASFNGPHGVPVDSFGNVYVGDQRNHRIRKILPSGLVSTLAGSGTAGGVKRAI
jgi:sugar lactone lactonase YvrE